MVTLPFPDADFRLVCLMPSEKLPPLAFDPFLYLLPSHVALQSGPNWQQFALLQNETVVALAHFFHDDDHYFSPWQAPFGGLQTKEQVPATITLAFLTEVIQYLQRRGAKTIKWLQCPDAYAPISNAIVTETLLNNGFELKYDQRNHHLLVTGQPFAETIHPSAKRRLKKCLQVGFTVQQAGVDQLPEAYALLQACRAEKQKPLSLSLRQLQNYFKLFPDRYRLFTVRQGAALAAVGVTVQVNGQILNHLYPASPTHFNSFSPTILLTQGIYSFCQQEGIGLLDLGVSAPGDEDEANYQGLFTFKERLGGLETGKPTFVWHQ